MRKINKDQLRAMIEVQKLTQREAAEVLGCNRTSVERMCKRMGLETQRTGPRSGDKHPDWKGGRILVGRYWYIYSPNHPNRTKANYMAEHRLVMEQVLGRLLLKSDVVHHINGDPSDNRPENLAVFQSNAEHLKHELTGQVPNHSPEGLAKMAEACRQSNIRRRGLKRGGSARIQTIDYPQAKS